MLINLLVFLYFDISRQMLLASPPKIGLYVVFLSISLGLKLLFFTIVLSLNPFLLADHYIQKNICFKIICIYLEYSTSQSGMLYIFLSLKFSMLDSLIES
jgi:hypothetical protein